MFDADDRNRALETSATRDIHVDYPDMIHAGAKFEDLLRSD